MNKQESNIGKRNQVELPLLLKQQARILFGLTGRQLLLITSGLAISVSLWQSCSSFQLPFFVLLGICSMPTVLSTLFAFVSIGTRPLEEWLFIVVIWMLTPERLTQRKQLLRTFVKVRSINDGIAVLEMGRGPEYYAILSVEVSASDLLDESEQITGIEEFRRLLDGLSYSVTIHVRITPDNSRSVTDIPLNLVRPLRRFYGHYLSFLSEVRERKKPMRVAYYIVVPADVAGMGQDEAQRLERAKVQLVQRISELSRQLRGHLTARRLAGRDLLLFYQQNFLSREDSNVPTSDMLVDANVPRSVAIAASWLRVEGRQTHDYCACLALTHLPRMVVGGWLRQLIQIHEPVEISIYIQPSSSDLVAKQLRRKAIELGGVLLAAEKQGKGGNTITCHALRDVEKVRDQLIRKEGHLFELTLLFFVRGATRAELNARVKHIQLVLRGLDFQATLLTFQHHLGYLSSLGYGHNMLHRYGHLLPTQAVASFYPFFHTPVMQEGVLLGTTDSGHLVSIDPFSKQRLNSNAAILGIPGAGKSFCLKVILSRLAPHTHISIIDVEREYMRWTQAVGGSRVCFSADSFPINPLELSPQAFPLQENALHTKIAKIIGFFALLIGNGTLEAHEKALLAQALTSLYKKHNIIASERRPCDQSIPTMAELYATVKETEPTSDICYRLEPYLHLFPNQTYISFEGKHIVYDLYDLQSDSLRSAAMYLIADRLWHELQAGRGDIEPKADRRKAGYLMVIDEAWFLFRSDGGNALLAELARRARKYHAGLWLGTQQIGDLLASEQGKSLIALCETKIVFKQDMSNIDAIHDELHLNTTQLEFVRTARRGEALYLTSTDAFGVEILASEYEENMAQTNIRAPGE